MEKKITVKDVAREAGVSVATVSYIMNDRKDQKISEETRKKVLQIANLLNYRPSHAAKTLATGKTNLIGVAYSHDSASHSRNQEITAFVIQLIEQLNQFGYNVLFISAAPATEELPLNGNIDGIIAIDLPEKIFRRLADHYLVPVICVDMCVSDPLFYQIYTDYTPRIKKAHEQMGADAYLVMDRFSNEAYDKRIAAEHDSKYLLYSEKLTHTQLLQLSDARVIAIGNYLAMALRPYVSPENLYVISAGVADVFTEHTITHDTIDLSHKAKVCTEILLAAISRDFPAEHDFPQ